MGSQCSSLPLPNKRVGFCQKLEAELQHLLGEMAWRVEGPAA
jgi:hypothetical protein